MIHIENVSMETRERQRKRTDRERGQTGTEGSQGQRQTKMGIGREEDIP